MLLEEKDAVIHLICDDFDITVVRSGFIKVGYLVVGT